MSRCDIYKIISDEMESEVDRWFWQEVVKMTIEQAKAEIRAEMEAKAAPPPRGEDEGPAHRPICPRCLGGQIKCDCMITPVDYPAPAAKCQHGPNGRCLACLTLAPESPAAEPLWFVRSSDINKFSGPFHDRAKAEGHAKYLGARSGGVIPLYPSPPRPEPPPLLEANHPPGTLVLPGAEWYFVAFDPSTDHPEYVGPFVEKRAAGDYAAPSGRYYVVFAGKSPTGAASEPKPKKMA
jgi:hypothetical protein